MISKSAVVISLLSILFIAGCVAPSPEARVGGYGVVINKFEPDYPDLESKEEVAITLEVQNTGGVKARDVYAYLLLDWVTREPKNQPIGDLTPPDEEADLPGQIRVLDWWVTTPDIPVGIPYTYEPIARVLYYYKTVASTMAPVLTDEEYQRLKREGKPIPAQTETVVSKGPLGVEIEARSYRVIDAAGRLMIRIIVQNLLDGNTFSPAHPTSDPEPGYEELNKINISITTSPEIAASVQAIDCQAFYGEDELVLRRGAATYPCELNVTGVTIRKDVPIQVELRYGYMIEATTQMTVRGVSY
jgi:hypothetical protein